MQLDVLWRSSQDTAVDHPVVSFTHHYDKPSGTQSYLAVPFEMDAVGSAADAGAGDLLVLRMTATQAAPAGPAFIPNGDGARTNGRIPSLHLP